jgi:hypothetical protein
MRGIRGRYRPRLSGPEDLPAFMIEARRCEGSAVREADIETAMRAVPALTGPDRRLPGGGGPPAGTQRARTLTAGPGEAGGDLADIPAARAGRVAAGRPLRVSDVGCQRGHALFSSFIM